MSRIMRHQMSAMWHNTGTARSGAQLRFCFHSKKCMSASTYLLLPFSVELEFQKKIITIRKDWKLWSMEYLHAQWLIAFTHWRYEIVIGAVSIPSLSYFFLVFEMNQLTPQISAYMISRYIYLSKFHPVSPFPGPRLASVSNLWLSYYRCVGNLSSHWHVLLIQMHRFVGKWPWAIEDALQKYGKLISVPHPSLTAHTRRWYRPHCAERIDFYHPASRIRSVT